MADPVMAQARDQHGADGFDLIRRAVQNDLLAKITGKQPPAFDVAPRDGEKYRRSAHQHLGDQRPAAAAFAFGLAELVQSNQIGACSCLGFFIESRLRSMSCFF